VKVQSVNNNRDGILTGQSARAKSCMLGTKERTNPEHTDDGNGNMEEGEVP
jgi:hypothetical protein